MAAVIRLKGEALARGKGRGGYRPPGNPAPVSGPGALSARTDGGPGQPIRVASGGDYGDRKASVEQQKAAPLASTAGTPGAGVASAAPSRQASPSGPEGIFGATQRPHEPVTAGIDWGPGPGAPAPPTVPDDPNMLLRAVLAQVGPHPDLVRLLARG